MSTAKKNEKLVLNSSNTINDNTHKINWKWRVS